MIKKILITTLTFSVITSSLISSVYCTENTSLTENPVPLAEVIASVNVLNDSSDLSLGLVQNSADMLELSKSLLNAGDTANIEYVRAMLKLSDDILDMAEKIGDMADRILDMSEDIGDMADRMIDTQNIQSDNAALTQSNILEAQKNFNTILNR